MRATPVIFSAILLVGCSNGNWGLNAVQFNSGTLAYPDDYKERVIEVMDRNGIETAGAVISSPANAVGASPFSERRWYVCVLGVPTKPRKEGLPVADKALASILDPAANDGIHNLVFFFSDVQRAPTMRKGFDSPLCRNILFQSLRLS